MREYALCPPLRKSVGIVLGAALFGVACTANDTAGEAITAACQETERDVHALRQRALQGEADAARCWIAIIDAEPSRSIGDGDRIAMRYVLWVITGEPPDDLLDMAAGYRRVDLINHLSLAHAQLEIGVHTGVLDDGCYLRPPEMDAIWRAARPGGGSRACEHATMPRKPAYDALSDEERRHMGRCRRLWWDIGSDYDGSLRAAGDWLPDDCLKYTRHGSWIGMGDPLDEYYGAPGE
jgi:hypothetical protein